MLMRPSSDASYLALRLHVTRHLCSLTMSSLGDNNQNLADKSVPYCSFEVSKAFSLLSSNEKLYTHFINKASWAGARIIQEQWTPYACNLYDLLTTIFNDGKEPAGLVDLEPLKSNAGLTDEEWEAMLQYTAQVCLYILLL
jgi:dipeptidyl-peptidase III